MLHGQLQLETINGLAHNLKKTLLYDVLSENFSLLSFFRGLDFHAMVPASAHKHSSNKCHG